MKKVYLIYDIARMRNMSREEIYIANKECRLSSILPETFYIETLATDGRHLYKAGLVKTLEESKKLPMIGVPTNDQGYVGECIDLNRLTEGEIDKETCYVGER